MEKGINPFISMAIMAIMAIMSERYNENINHESCDEKPVF
jgi:hypothetical protein